MLASGVLGGLSGFLCLLAVLSVVSAAKGDTDDLSVGAAFTISGMTLLFGGYAGYGAWRLWPRRSAATP
jgi:hypothetical protein